MGNNFMACSEASNFDAIIIAPIHFILHSIRYTLQYFGVCVCLSLKSISLPFSRHITLPISLSLCLSRPLSLHFYLFSIQCAQKHITGLGCELFRGLFGGATVYSISSSVVISLALVVTIFSVTVIFITGYFTKLNCHPFSNALDAIFYRLFFSSFRLHCSCCCCCYCYLVYLFHFRTNKHTRSTTVYRYTYWKVRVLSVKSSTKLPEAHNFQDTHTHEHTLTHAQTQRDRQKNKNKPLFCLWILVPLCPSKHTEIYGKYFGTIQFV